MSKGTTKLDGQRYRRTDFAPPFRTKSTNQRTSAPQTGRKLSHRKPTPRANIADCATNSRGGDQSSSRCPHPRFHHPPRPPSPMRATAFLGRAVQGRGGATGFGQSGGGGAAAKRSCLVDLHRAWRCCCWFVDWAVFLGRRSGGGIDSPSFSHGECMLMGAGRRERSRGAPPDAVSSPPRASVVDSLVPLSSIVVFDPVGLDRLQQATSKLM